MTVRKRRVKLPVCFVPNADVSLIREVVEMAFSPGRALFSTVMCIILHYAVSLSLPFKNNSLWLFFSQ